MLMADERNKEISRRYFDQGWNEGDLQTFNDILPKGFVLHHNGPEVCGLDAFIQLVLSNRAGFPDLHFTIEETMAVGKKVVVRWTARGTHRGDWRGIAATGNTVTSTGIDIHHIVNGAIVEVWSNSDSFGLHQQLKAIPADLQHSLNLATRED